MQDKKIEGSVMSKVENKQDLRENFENYFELAKKNPIAINRGSDRYVLLSESEFVKMKEESMNLQKSLISTLQTLNEGGATEYIDVDGHHKKLLDEVLS